MQKVFVLDIQKTPLMPCHPARARELLSQKQANVFRRFPFTIILKKPTENRKQDIELKIDPGSKTTGLCLTGHFKKGVRVLFAANLHHRGEEIKLVLQERRALRRSRRNRKTRYRKPRFNNRFKSKGTLPPSLRSRLENVKNWSLKVSKLSPITLVAVETVRFDMQKMLNPEISGVEYQQGELWGYEVREYLLEKWQRTCAYCQKKNVPLEIEHITPRSRGGSDRLSNLTLACRECNIKKGNKLLEEWLTPTKAHSQIMAKLKARASSPLKDAAAVNSTRKAIGNELQNIFTPVTFWSGGRTKKNRLHQGYKKDHWIDAACVGITGEKVFLSDSRKGAFVPLQIQAEKRGGRQMCLPDRFGFPRTRAKAQKRVFGFQTGDLVKAHVTKGKKQGFYEGKVAIRSNGYFNIKTKIGTIQGIHHSFCKMVQKADGYSYKLGDTSKNVPMLTHRSSPEGISIPPRPKGRSLLEISR